MSDCLVERVAWAMFDKLMAQTDPWSFAHGNDPASVVMDGSFDLTEIAVWAIEAMRSPTPEMIKAYWDRCDMGGDLLDDRGPDEREGEHIARAFSAMIKAALK